MLMFIWCFDHFVFIAWGIDKAIINEASSSQLDNDNKSRQMEPENKHHAVIQRVLYMF